MGTLTPIADAAKTAFRIAAQPALFALKRTARYRSAGVADEHGLGVCRVRLQAGAATCTRDCPYTLDLARGHLGEYRGAGVAWRLKPWLGTACLIPLADHGSFAAYEAAVRRRTGDAIRRVCNKARRQGYVTSFFHPPYLRGAMAEVLASKRFRSGGLVPYGLLGRYRGAPDHGHVDGYRPQAPCPLHWTLTFGVFATGSSKGPAMPGPGGSHPIALPAAATWRLAGFLKIRRTGSLVHALQIMTHGDHLAAGANDLMHMDLVRWLMDDPDGLAGGVSHYLYGALEHAGQGLAAWKLRRGFVPMLLASR